MYQDLKHIYGRKLGAIDGEIGHVKDFLFDDTTWAIRYLVVDTGGWLSGRQVLLTPHAFGPRALSLTDAAGSALLVTLTRKQIEDSPSVDTERPVSRQYEEEFYRYYGWPVYWEGGGMWGAAGIPSVPPPPPPGAVPLEAPKPKDIHLRSTKAVTGYQIQTTDGAIGTVSSFTVEVWSWGIRELVVETGHWYAGKPIFLLPADILRISYEDSTVFVNLSKEDLQQTTKNDVAQPAIASVGPGDPTD
jgi:hypothetical protein